jgi:truncated hemoglobin YjbI
MKTRLFYNVQPNRTVAMKGKIIPWEKEIQAIESTMRSYLSWTSLKNHTTVRKVHTNARVVQRLFHQWLMYLDINMTGMQKQDHTVAV